MLLCNVTDLVTIEARKIIRGWHERVRLKTSVRARAREADCTGIGALHSARTFARTHHNPIGFVCVHMASGWNASRMRLECSCCSDDEADLIGAVLVLADGGFCQLSVSLKASHGAGDLWLGLAVAELVLDDEPW